MRYPCLSKSEAVGVKRVQICRINLRKRDDVCLQAFTMRAPRGFKRCLCLKQRIVAKVDAPQGETEAAGMILAVPSRP